MTIVKFTIVAVELVLAFVVVKSLTRRAKRKRLLAMSFSEEWKQIVRKNAPLYNRLPDSLKEYLHGLVHVFIAEKNFEGCGGLEITDEVKVTIAAQASMLLLNRRATYTGLGDNIFYVFQNLVVPHDIGQHFLR